ncbi:MAG TPA: DoxX family protein [Candidatus Acidoferrum sp.]|nr:DoxX family protein [Candidatus Acidoferrum sp.]
MSTGTFARTSAAPASSSSPNFALLIFRIAGSLPVLYHGGGILFGAFGGPRPQGFADYQHISLMYAYLVGLAQFAGGLAILLGLFQRIGSICVIVVMIGAIYRVHLPNGFDIGKGGMEFALTVLLISLGLLISGPGAFSLGRILPGPLKKL